MQPALFALALTLTAGDPALPQAGSDGSTDVQVERAARDFRIETYQTFRLDREAYDRHIAAGQEVLHAWQRNPGDEDSRGELLAWYENARQLVRSGQAAPPTAPDWLGQQADQLAAEATDDEALPDVVIEFDPAESAAPPAAAATPVPPLEELREESQATEQADGSDELDELGWTPPVESFDFTLGEELLGRRDGYNSQVREIVTHLGGDWPWTSSNLEPIASQLSELAGRREILQIEWQVQAPTAAGDSPELLSLDPALALFAQRLEEAYRNIEFLPGSEDQAAENERLDELTQMVGGLTDGN